MRVSLVTDDKIIDTILPFKINGSFWIQTKEGNKINNLINIEAKDNKWYAYSNQYAKIQINNLNYKELIISDYMIFQLSIVGKTNLYYVYCMPYYDNSIETYRIKKNAVIEIGSGNEEINLKYDLINLLPHHAKLSYQGVNGWTITASDQKAIFVNNIKVKSAFLKSSDVIFIGGLRITILNQFLLINNPLKKLIINCPYLEKIFLNPVKDIDTSYINDEEMSIFSDENYFNRIPRFRKNIEIKEIKVDSPPNKKNDDNMNMIITYGPMFTMGLSSIAMLSSNIINLQTGKTDMISAIPTFVMSGSMLATMMVWPLITNKYKKYKDKKYEEKRKHKYREYLNKKLEEINKIINEEKEILLEEYQSAEECKKIISEKNSKLWKRKVEHNDFLTVRLGLGTKKANINIKSQEEHFTLDDDILKDEMNKLVLKSTNMNNVPIITSFIEKNIQALLSYNKDIMYKYLNSIIIQLMTFQSWDDLKLVIITSEENEKKFEYVKISPFCFSNNKEFRLFATKLNDVTQITNYLRDILNERMEEKNNNKFYPHYLVITDNYEYLRNNDFINKLLEIGKNYGFSFLICDTKINQIPNECSDFINIEENNCSTYNSSLSDSSKIIFTPDNFNDTDIYYYSMILSNIPIYIKDEYSAFPDVITFLEMYNVGRVEQLNALNNWKNNNPVISLQVPVGIDQNGELFKLDIHEKVHGPHGLIAGMTGSGKSEFIITYILSLAINYSPEEVQFVIIDYKGGGLAYAFENLEANIKLPHLIGTITNLEKSEINRVLISIESELKRRQKKFNEVRDALNEGTIDIYKYQKLYREGKINEPISHLLIISDEFAELKTQQPEFMDQLISIARIGRSLGVHLILATQKPSGVVNDQIWSNAKFKICLKVQDKNDSNDMIKNPKAASIKNAGRFYLQVGYDDLLELGQSAWSGAPYFETDVRKKKTDLSINFIDNTSYIIKSTNINKKEKIESMGEELTNIIKYLSDIENIEKHNIRKLWLDKMSNKIYLSNLIKKYNFIKKTDHIEFPIGEYDYPERQLQDILTLSFTSKNGNIAIYGVSGSGKEMLIQTIIVSSSIYYSPEDINYYIVDCGAETMKIFNNFPQVGDVMYNSENEKITNLFKFLNSEYSRRKKILSNYNGDIDFYNKTKEKKLPYINIIINYFDTFLEQNDYLEIILSMTRDSAKYGIIFTFTTANITSISYKLKNNIGITYALQLKDEYDYPNIIGKTKIILARNIGRGLTKVNDVIHEFQTSLICDDKDKLTYLNDLTSKLLNYYTINAPKIKILPETISLNDVNIEEYNLSNIPIGISKEDLEIESFNFDNYINVISSNDNKFLKKFVNLLYIQIEKLNMYNVVMLDEKNTSINVKKENNIVIINNFYDFFEKIDKNIKDKLYKLMEIKNNKIKFILSDSVDKYELLRNEMWMNNLSRSNFIWIGDGIDNQLFFKQNYDKNLKNNIKYNFGYTIKNGNAKLVKFIEEEDVKDEQ